MNSTNTPDMNVKRRICPAVYVALLFGGAMTQGGWCFMLASVLFGLQYAHVYGRINFWSPPMIMLLCIGLILAGMGMYMGAKKIGLLRYGVAVKGQLDRCIEPERGTMREVRFVYEDQHGCKHTAAILSYIPDPEWTVFDEPPHGYGGTGIPYGMSSHTSSDRRKSLAKEKGKLPEEDVIYDAHDPDRSMVVRDLYPNMFDGCFNGSLARMLPCAHIEDCGRVVMPAWAGFEVLIMPMLVIAGSFVAIYCK